MGQGKSSGLQDVTSRVEKRAGKVATTGRYHRLPKRIADDYEVSTKVLGSGYNGQVHMAKGKQDKKKFAVKGFKLHGVSKEKRDELESEAEIFLAMDHPHVARLVDVYESEEQLMLVMECMDGGELFQRVTEKKRFSEKDAANAVWQMLLSVNYIHSHAIVHRDLKLENFLYDSKDSDHLKLIDFGFSKIWDRNTKMDLSCGTLAYVAPEVLEKNYTSQCDLWSLGVIVFILLVGYMPFSGSEQHQVRCIKEGKYTLRKEVWAKVSDLGRDFVMKLLEKDPSLRLSADKALEHEWIAKREKHSTGNMDQGIVDALCNFADASQFRRTCMSMMAWSLTNEERAQVREIFISMDQDKKGTIKLWELRKVLVEKFHIPKEQSDVIFKALDQNHDEEIHYSDFLAAMVSSRIAVHDDLLQKTFKRFDTDNSGFITSDNLKSILGETLSGAEIDQVMTEADSSGDGKICYQEFVEYVRNGGTVTNTMHQDVACRLIDNEPKKGPDGALQAAMRRGLDLACTLYRQCRAIGC
eukprot:gnl/TRDRNA2_/TRDRNA2_176381_c3_seq3.p1 gnl/TRDRNA2_/TRDRNA2_176381_c3~~gnl/TRDRNA2_/TRDRNA2_176381_c3_seq3.p1  ORF type:complete len:526 (-),score=127.44 gnl/TRDRNA2_/TRDRNA2_176381_c3_seq3:32-1609(-)